MTTGQFRLIDFVDDMCAGRDVFLRFLRVAKDIMTVDVRVLTAGDTVGAAARFMIDNLARHVPVLEVLSREGEKARFLGVVSQRDVLRQMPPPGRSRDKGAAAALHKPLATILTRNPTSVSPETPMIQVIKTLIQVRVDMVPVLDDGDVVGIITATDIIRLLVRLDRIRRLLDEQKTGSRLADLSSGRTPDAAGFLLSALESVQNVMSRDVVCLRPQDNLKKCIEAFRAGTFRHVPVVDGQGKLLGVLSDRDVLLMLPPLESQSPKDASQGKSHLFAVDPGDPVLDAPAGECMTRDIESIPASCSVFHAARMLDKKRVGCLPVIDDGGHVQGMVTVTDIMRAVVALYSLASASESLCEKPQVLGCVGR